MHKDSASRLKLGLWRAVSEICDDGLMSCMLHQRTGPFVRELENQYNETIVGMSREYSTYVILHDLKGQ